MGSARNNISFYRALRRGRALVLGLASGVAACAQGGGSASQPQQGKITFAECKPEGVAVPLQCGVLNVPENRITGKGKTLPIKVVRIAAKEPAEDSAPIFFLAGGPGETATELAEFLVDRGLNAEHDVILIDERGTGEGHRLDCPPPWSDDNLSAYLEGPFVPEAAAQCAAKLSKDFDLSQYTTLAHVEDLNDVRVALGYDKILIDSGSFGTYAAQHYMRRYPETVEAAYLNSLVTASMRVPLHMAASSQAALDRIFDRCEADAGCSAAFPNVRGDFYALLEELKKEPAQTTIRHPRTGAPADITVTHTAFADAVRLFMYSSENARRLPLLIAQAREGDFAPLVEALLGSSIGINENVRMGLNYAITCNEFVNRIADEDVGKATAGSFLGATRVERQRAACASWPETALPDDQFAPFHSEVPALLISGGTDPVSPSHWADEVAASMPNAVHIVVPGAGHTPFNACLADLQRQLFRRGSTDDLDLGCVKEMKPLPFVLPGEAAARE